MTVPVSASNSSTSMSDLPSPDFPRSSAVRPNGEMGEANKSEVEFRRRALRNMWTIIVTIFVVVTYSSLYSIALYIWADSDCFV